MMTTRFHRSRVLLSLLTMALGALALSGCESDTTAPQDPLPAPTAYDTVVQAAFTARAAAVVAPEILQGAKAATQRVFFGPVSGAVWLDYRLGGPNGADAAWDTADYAHLYTDAEGGGLDVSLGMGGNVNVTFDIEADIDQGADSAVVDGGGVFTSGYHVVAFAIDGLTVTRTGAYPSAGTLTVGGGGIVASVTFDGTAVAVIAVNGTPEYELDMDQGELTELD